MSVPEHRQWLQAGIKALKAGEREQARALLMQVIERDEQNEQAWLWLSGAVTSKEERRTCLENVLSINPKNQLARKGLLKLGVNLEKVDGDLAENAMFGDDTAVFPTSPGDKKTTFHRELPPLSPAAAILYPERQVKEWEWHDPTPEHKPSKVGFVGETTYDDVWSRNDDICAYCAAQVTQEDEHCPQCQRNLVVSHFRYPTPSANLHVLWVLLFSISLFSLVQLFYSIVFLDDMLRAVFNGFLMIIFSGLAIGIYFRRFQAYIATLILLVFMLAVTLAQYLLPPAITNSLLAGFDASIAGLLGGVASGVGEFIRIFRLVAVVLALFIVLVQVSPDFDRVAARQLAVIGHRMSTAADFHTAAKEAAKAEMWATAVLHWQRAAAKEPTNILYQRYLGQAYAQLGFYKRSLDVLQSARERATHPDIQKQLDQLIHAAQQKKQTTTS